MKTYIGIDNGNTGAIAGIKADGELLFWSKTPVRKVASYAKKGGFLTRIDRAAFKKLLEPFADGRPVMVVMENPKINPASQFVHSNFAAATAHEAEVGVLEDLGLPHAFIAAVTWQKELLPGQKGTFDTKKASVDVGQRLFPKLVLPKGEDADAVLIAEYARRKNL